MFMDIIYIELIATIVYFPYYVIIPCITNTTLIILLPIDPGLVSALKVNTTILLWIFLHMYFSAHMCVHIFLVYIS